MIKCKSLDLIGLAMSQLVDAAILTNRENMMCY